MNAHAGSVRNERPQKCPSLALQKLHCFNTTPLPMHDQSQQGRVDTCTARMPVKRRHRKAQQPAMLQGRLVRSCVIRRPVRQASQRTASLWADGMRAGPCLTQETATRPCAHTPLRKGYPWDAARRGCPARARSGVEAHGLGGRRVGRARAGARGRQRHAARQAAARVRREDEQRARRRAGHDALLRADRERGERAAAAFVAHHALRVLGRGHARGLLGMGMGASRPAGLAGPAVGAPGQSAAPAAAHSGALRGRSSGRAAPDRWRPHG